MARLWARHPMNHSSTGKNFLLSKASKLALGPSKPPTQWVAGVPFPGVQQLVQEADYSDPSSAELKNE